MGAERGEDHRTVARRHRRHDDASAARIDEGDAIAAREPVERHADQRLGVGSSPVDHDRQVFAPPRGAFGGRGDHVDAHEDFAAPGGDARVARSKHDREPRRGENVRPARPGEAAITWKDEADGGAPGLVRVADTTGVAGRRRDRGTRRRSR